KLLINYANNNSNIILNINEKDKNENYPLLKAVILNDIEIVKLLMDYATRNNHILEINDKNEDGYTPIFGVMDNNNFEIFKMLVNYAKNNSIKLLLNENDIEKVISKNVYYVHLKSISEVNSKFKGLIYLYKTKNIIEIIFSENNYFLKRFIESSENEEEEKRKLIMKRKKIMEEVKMERENNRNDTLLTLECKKGNINEVKKLLNDNKNDINEKNKYGDTPLIIACKKNNIELVEYLLTNDKLNINMKSDYGINPLLVACYFNNKDLVDHLVNHGAIIEIFDPKNNLPLHIACYLKNFEITKLLVSKNHKLSNVENSFSYTPMEIVEELNDNKITKYLKEGIEVDDDEPESENEEYYEHEENKVSYEKVPLTINKFIDKINRSICEIRIDNIVGTGFFIEIPVPSKEKSMCGLMTNNHVLDESRLKSNKFFNIYMPNNEKESIKIEINDENFVFTSELIDVTFIEINIKTIKEIDPIFLHPCEKDVAVNESVLIYQYAKAQYSFAHGNIIDIKSFNYVHEVMTNDGASGSPLLNKNYEVVGIHKSKLFNKNNNCDKNSKRNNKSKEMKSEEKTEINSVNIAVKYSEVEFAIRTSFNNINIYGMEKSRKSAKLLSETEMKILNNYGLQLKLSSHYVNKLETKIINEEKIKEKKLKDLEIVKKSYFYCTFSDKFLFYRTNYAWYITILSKKGKNYISKDEYDLDAIKQLKWSPIISYNLELNKTIETKIINRDGICREYILITWLKLTELMYL
ncbi:ankyrin, partial [Neocallimastix sp. 'constans']